MAQPPTKPAIPPAKPPPSPLAKPETTEATQLSLNIHGQPPKSNMAPASSVDEDNLAESTQAEVDAGKKALETNKARQNAELEAGKRIVDRLSRVNSQS